MSVTNSVKGDQFKIELYKENYQQHSKAYGSMELQCTNLYILRNMF